MKSGIEHIVATVPVPKSEFESEELHNLTHGNTFPASPVERQLYYRDDQHMWYQYRNAAWRALASAGEITLNDISDVNVAAPTDGYVLYWDDAAGKFKLKAAPVGSVVIWKDAPENALTDTSRTTQLTFTDLDLTAFTSANAKLAYLWMRCQAPTPGSAGDNIWQLRKNGTTPAYPITVRIYHTDIAEQIYDCYCILGLDSGQVIEYQLTPATGGTIHTWIHVLGYIE